jgi:hypothetical protein
MVHMYLMGLYRRGYLQMLRLWKLADVHSIIAIDSMYAIGCVDRFVAAP